MGVRSDVHSRQQAVIEYLQEELRVLQEQLGKRPRFTDDQRRRLAVKGKSVGRKGMTWKEFLRTYWGVIAATDFFTAEVWTPAGLVRYHVLFVIRLATREIKIAGIVPEPHGQWMSQMARNLTDAADGALLGYRFLIQDRYSLFTEQFRQTLRSAGVESLKLPSTVNLNAHAERFVRTIKESCLDNMILFGESALRESVFQFVEHSHQEWNHQGLENKIIRPEFAEFPQPGTIRSRRRLGGLLRYYCRDAA